MSDEPTPGRDLASLAGVVAPALAISVAVAFAATGTGLLRPGADIGDAATGGIRLGGVALAVVGLSALLTRRGGAARVAPKALGAVLLAATVAMAGVTTATYVFSPVTLTVSGDDEPTTTERPTTTTTERETTTTTEEEADDETGGTGFDLLDLVAMLVPLALFAAVVGLLVYALARIQVLTSPEGRRRGVPPPVPGRAVPLEAAAAEAGLEASLDAVTADTSPRDAITDAYARLLAALLEAGAGRRSYEAPHEHLDRVLGPLGVRSAPLHRLAELFVLARFSQHPVTAAHRDDASGALRDALADLRAAEARRTRTTPTGAAR